MWSRNLILISTLITSGVSVWIPIVIAGYIGPDIVSYWVGGRAAIQAMMALVPNPINGLLYTQDNVSIRNALISGSILAVFVILSVIAANSVWGKEIYYDIIYLYAFVFLALNYARVLLRIIKRSDLILSTSILDSILTFVLLILLITYKDFSLFVFFASIKELVVFLFIAFQVDSKCFKGKDSTIDGIKKLNKYMLLHSFRAGLQVLMQYGDRIFFPIIFGLTISGKAAIGSSLAMIIGMLSSSAFSWALPLVMDESIDKQYVYREWRKLTFLVLVLVLALMSIMPYVNLALNLIFNNKDLFDEVVLFSFMYSSVSSVNYLGMLKTKERFERKTYFSIFFVGYFLSFFVMYFFLLDGVSQSLCIFIGCLFNYVFYCVLNFNFVKVLDVIAIASFSALIAGLGF